MNVETLITVMQSCEVLKALLCELFTDPDEARIILTTFVLGQSVSTPCVETGVYPRDVVEFVVGKLPSKLFVCHRCDNPPCCRIDHLFLGSPSQNIQDALLKGRMGLRKRVSSKNKTERRLRKKLARLYEFVRMTIDKPNALELALRSIHDIERKLSSADR